MISLIPCLSAYCRRISEKQKQIACLPIAFPQAPDHIDSPGITVFAERYGPYCFDNVGHEDVYYCVRVEQGRRPGRRSARTTVVLHLKGPPGPYVAVCRAGCIPIGCRIAASQRRPGRMTCYQWPSTRSLSGCLCRWRQFLQEGPSPIETHRNF